MLEPRRRERVDAIAEDDEQGGQGRERDGAGDDRGDRAGDAHRVEEARGEHEQRQHRGGDRQRAEDHGPPGGLERSKQRVAAGAHALDLLAIAREDEERVVDREAEPEPDREVQGEDRQQQALVDDAQAEEGPHDREQADEQRQQRGDGAPEDDERQEEQERERERLGAGEVLGDLVGDLRDRDRVAADRHAGNVRELLR